MRLDRILTRDDLYNLIACRCPLATFKRCFDDAGASITNLGAFKSIPPGLREPGWIVKFITKFGVTRYLAVSGITHKQWEIDKVPWSTYIGADMTNPLYTGDLTDAERRTEIDKVE